MPSAQENFYLYRSGHFEYLSGTLARLLARKGNPFVPRTIVVQSAGAAAKLQQEIAGYSGICANTEFPYPGTFINNNIFSPTAEALGFGASRARTPDDIPYSPEIMAWQLFQILPEALRDPDFRVLDRYAEKADGLKIFQLAQCIAKLYDSYLVYRPDMIRAWDSGYRRLSDSPAEVWQMKLWNKLTQMAGGNHFSTLYHAFIKYAYREEHPNLFPEMPALDHIDLSSLERLESIYFFGFSALPPTFLELFYAIAQFVQVHFFYLTPCEEEFSGIYRHRSAERNLRRVLIGDSTDDPGMDPDEHEHAVRELLMLDNPPHPLLTNWGEQGSAFADLILGMQCNEIEMPENPLFEEDRELSLLEKIQRGILLNETGDDSPLYTMNDGSIQLHSCHSPMREVEVLYNNLLNFFDLDPELRQQDIIVMTPDIEKYAPYIEAVFKTVENEGQYIKVAIADRSEVSEIPEANAFFMLCKLHEKRFCSNDILALLECDSLREAFGIADEDLPRLRSWFSQTGLLWGIDAEYRESETGCRFREFSWEAAMDRMFAGFCLESEDEITALWPGVPGDEDQIITPCRETEGSNAFLLGKLADFFDAVKRLHCELGHITDQSGGRGNPEKTPELWRDFLYNALDCFFSETQEYVSNLRILKNAVSRLYSAMTAKGTSGMYKVRPDVVISELENMMSMPGDHRFLRGGITFCQARPMRTIPAKIICMLGMNEGDFPRRDRMLSFDLMRSRFRPGDRSLRTDDRLLFLENLLAARKCLYISYIGQSLRDNSPLPISVTVSELLDFINRDFGIHEDELTVVHPLQSFSPDYFTGKDGKLFSFSEVDLKCAKQLTETPSDNYAFFFADNCAITAANLPESLAFPGLEQLCRFLENPARFFLNHRLGVYPDIRDYNQLPEFEPLELSAREIDRQAQKLLESVLKIGQGQPPEEFFETTRKYLAGSGKLPVGFPGKQAFSAIMDTVSGYLGSLEAYCTTKPIRITVDTMVDQYPLQVNLDNIYINNITRKAEMLLLHVGKAGGDSRVVINWLLRNIALGLPEVRELLHRKYGIESVSCQYICHENTLAKRKTNLPFVLPVPLPGAAIERFKSFFELWTKGLESPLPFHGKSALAYISKRYPTNKKESDELAAFDKASEKWHDHNYGTDVHLAKCFSEEFPDDPGFRSEFAAIAETVFFPYLPASN